jgi:hypothetical protein
MSSDMNAAMAQAIERINELEAEVRVLKRALAEAHGKLAGCETEKPSQASIVPILSRHGRQSLGGD